MFSGPFAGFGIGPYGTMPFGTSMPPESPLEVLALFVLRENLVRVQFNTPPRYTRLGDPNDASDSRRYTISVVTDSTGRDGEATRPVTVVAVEEVPGSGGTMLDLITDRPMSPEPGQYDLTISGLVSAANEAPLPTQTIRYTALFKGLTPLTPEFVINNRDIANPQTLTGIFDPLPVATGQELDPLLGTFREDSQGDIAFDEGLAGLKKRIFRRLTTRRGKFAHLPDYGVSTITSVKQLARAGIREWLADEAEQQIKQEPEVVDVSVNIVVDPTTPELARYQIRVRTNFGPSPNFDVPVAFSPTGT